MTNASDTTETFVSLIIPALNEEKAIGAVLDALPRGLLGEVIVCDNGSQDATASIAASKGARVVTEPKRGYGAACLKALSNLSPRSTIVAFIDADHSDDPQQLGLLLEPILSGRIDFVVGSRVRLAVPGALNFQQRFGNRLATILMRIFFNAKWSDLGPFRAIRAKSLRQLQMCDDGMGWTVEMQIKAVRQKLRCGEVDVSYSQRIGRSKISGTLSGTVRAGSKILWLIFRYGLTPKG